MNADRRDRAVAEATTRGRAARRCTPVTFLPATQRMSIVRRYFPAVAYGLMIGIGLWLAALAYVAVP